MRNFDHLKAIGDKNLRIYLEREDQTERIALVSEEAFLSLIQNGQVEKIQEFIGKMENLGDLTSGKMSFNSLKQAQYMAVAFITLGVRSAIRGGVLETEALSISDYFIQKIDSCKREHEVVELIFQMMLNLTQIVKNTKNSGKISYVKKMIDYVFKNLHCKISLQDLANGLNFSVEHLSRQFKKEMGMTFSHFVLTEKINASKTMLLSKALSTSEIAHTLGFSSQSHFISSFKKIVGVTPREFLIKF